MQDPSLASQTMQRMTIAPWADQARKVLTCGEKVDHAIPPKAQLIEAILILFGCISCNYYILQW